MAPRQLRDVRLVAADYRGRPLGVLSERSGRRLTAVLACRVVAFSLLDHEAQERRLARWGLVLSGAGGTAIRRVQWIERTAPAQGDELARWVHAERDPAVPLRGTPMIDSYLELISSTARVTQEHEILLAIQVDAQRVRDRGDDASRARWWSRPSASPRAWRRPRSRCWARSARASSRGLCGPRLIPTPERS